MIVEVVVFRCRGDDDELFELFVMCWFGGEVYCWLI